MVLCLIYENSQILNKTLGGIKVLFIKKNRLERRFCNVIVKNMRSFSKKSQKAMQVGIKKNKTHGP